jgi:hypothetical protein
MARRETEQPRATPGAEAAPPSVRKHSRIYWAVFSIARLRRRRTPGPVAVTPASFLLLIRAKRRQRDGGDWSLGPSLDRSVRSEASPRGYMDGLVEYMRTRLKCTRRESTIGAPNTEAYAPRCYATMLEHLRQTPSNQVQRGQVKHFFLNKTDSLEKTGKVSNFCLTCIEPTISSRTHRLSPLPVLTDS